MEAWRAATQNPGFDPIGLIGLLTAALGLGRLAFYLWREE
jgi:hypothetical protein